MRRWSRFLLRCLLWSLLSLLLLTLAVGYWLSTSGRLAAIATHFAQRLSGQDITIRATTLRSWHTIVFTDIALHIELDGWHLTILCPEVAARVGLWGLFTQQVQSLLMTRPHITLQLPVVSATTPPTASPSPTLPALPVQRLIVRQGRLDLVSPQRQHTVEQLSLHLWQEREQLHTAFHGALPNSLATLHLQGRFLLEAPLLTGSLHVQAKDIPSDYLAPFLPTSWQVAQGTLALEGDMSVQGAAGQGQFSLHLARLQGQVQDFVLDDMHLTTQASWQGNFAQRTHTLRGATTLRLAHLYRATHPTPLTDLTLHMPLQFTLEPSSWHLISRDGTLQAAWHQTTHTLQPLLIDVKTTATEPVLWEIETAIPETPGIIRLSGHTATHPTIQMTGQHIPLTLFGDLWHQYLPDTWRPSQGILAFTGTTTFQEETLQGTASVSITDGQLHHDDLHFQAASLTLHTTFTQHRETFAAAGQLHLQVPEVRGFGKIAGTEVDLTSSFDFTRASPQWTLQAKPALRSTTLQVGATGRLGNLHLTSPLEIHSTSQGIQGQGPVTVSAQTLTWQLPGEQAALFETRDIQGKLTLHFQQTAVEIRDARLRTGPWKQQTQNAIFDHLDLQASTRFDLSRRQGTLHSLRATVGKIARIRSSGVWDWQRGTLHDLQLQTILPDLALFRQSLTPWLPEATHPWDCAGEAILTVQMPLLALHAPWAAENIQLTLESRNSAFNTGQYATEKLHGKVHTTIAFDPQRSYYTIQGHATVQPFALLLGTFLPDFTTRNISPEVTFTATYAGQPARLHLTFSGDFDSLGALQGKVTLQEPLFTAPYEVAFTIAESNLETAWQTLFYDSALFPALAKAQVQGHLHLSLELQGSAQGTVVQGVLRTQSASFVTPLLALNNLNLTVPLQGRYPLPPTMPDLTSLPASAYGTLSLDSLRIGNVPTGAVHTRFVFSSDNFWMPEGFQVDLLGGQFSVDSLLVQNFLQAGRRLTSGVTVKHVDLQHIPPTPETLPIAGILEGAFPHIEIFQGHLTTEGSVLWQVADGQVRLTALQGDDLFLGSATLQCDIVTEQPLSLTQLTRLYPIGAMSGTLEIDLQNFTINSGVPTAFQLRFAVREDSGEPREITLRALNNLLFTTGTAQIAAGLFGIGDTYRLPYRRFGAIATLRNDILQLRGRYHDREGKEYFMQAPALGHGVSIVNQVPDNGISFQAFMQRLRATVLEKPQIQLSPQR